MRFVARAAAPVEPAPAAWWFVFQGDRLLVKLSGAAATPLAADDLGSAFAPLRQVYLGYLQDEGGQTTDCFAAEIAAGVEAPPGTAAEGLRQLYTPLGDLLWGVAGRAAQVLAWDRTNQFCGQCGNLTEVMANERARRCARCGLVNYPRLSPAIIIAIVRRAPGGDELLLARNHRFPAGRYSVLAGFVEPGESLEECAEREVWEEAHIHIKNVRYFGSQPWPFPNSLMIGFTAEYDGGDLLLEDAELADARWFRPGEMPDLPPKMTIARQLIDWFLRRMPADGE